MSNVNTDVRTIMKRDRIIREARKISDIKVIVKSGKHKAQRVILRDNTMCLVDKKTQFIK